MELGAHRNIFAIPHEEGYLIYAPLANRVVYANAAGVARVKEFLLRPDPALLGEDLIEGLGGLDWLSPRPEPVALPSDRHFHPTAVTLFLTSRCNLRCTYCYASAGETKASEMPAAVYRAAIDVVARNARRAGRAPAVGFHGGGEPTMAWDALIHAIDYARQISEGTCGKPPSFGIATNGVMSREHAEFVATTFPVVTLSCDGPAEIHNAQRPFPNGSGSFDAVRAFIDVLQQHNTPLVVRSTITERNADRQAELVDFLVDQTGCEQLHFEPVFASGRRLSGCGNPLAPMAFADGFVAALQHARRRNVTLRYSAARIAGAFLSFCGCAQDGFNVTPHGDVSACFEVCDRADPRADVFFYGRFDPASSELSIDYSRLARLRRLVVHNKAACNACFARWTCSGDCPIKAEPEVETFTHEGPRCEMNRSITKALLVEALRSSQQRQQAGAGPRHAMKKGRIDGARVPMGPVRGDRGHSSGEVGP